MMIRYVWLALLLLPPWAATEIGAPKWVLFLAVLPFFIRAATLGDESPEDNFLGEGFAKHRTIIQIFIIITGLALGAGLLRVLVALAGQS